VKVFNGADHIVLVVTKGAPAGRCLCCRRGIWKRRGRGCGGSNDYEGNEVRRFRARRLGFDAVRASADDLSCQIWFSRFRGLAPAFSPSVGPI
jgi:hypothetical protein